MDDIRSYNDYCGGTASYERWLNIQHCGYDSETEMKRMSLNDREITG